MCFYLKMWLSVAIDESYSDTQLWLNLFNTIPWLDIISSSLWFDLISFSIWFNLIKYYSLTRFNYFDSTAVPFTLPIEDGERRCWDVGKSLCQYRVTGIEVLMLSQKNYITLRSSLSGWSSAAYFPVVYSCGFLQFLTSWAGRACHKYMEVFQG